MQQAFEVNAHKKKYYATFFMSFPCRDRIRSGNISLSHLYCAAFTHYLCKSDVTEEETFDGKPRVYDIESTGEEEMEGTNSSHSAMA